MLVIPWKKCAQLHPRKEGIDPESATSHVLGSQRCNKRIGKELSFLWFLDFLSLEAANKMCILNVLRSKSYTQDNVNGGELCSEGHMNQASVSNCPHHNIREKPAREKANPKNVQISKVTSSALSVICLLWVRDI